MPKLLMTIFTENSSIGVSMLCNMAAEVYQWDVDVFFVPQNEDSTALNEYIRSFKPDIVGISFKSFERSQALQVVREVRSEFPELPLLAGGIHATLQPKDVLNSGSFNAVVVGDGLGILGDILKNYRSYAGEILQGHAYPDKNMYCRFFHSSSQIERMRRTGTAAVLSTIGGPFHCTFCHSGSESFQVLPIESVAAYVIRLNKEHGVHCFHFVDDLFAGNLKRLRRFRAIIESTLPDFSISSQISGKPSTFTPDIAVELVKLGAETVNFGVETASPRMLTFLQKKQTVEDCYRAIEICHRFGLNAVVNLMFGIPTQTAEDYQHTLDYVAKAKPDSITTFYYSPYPGTVLYNFCFDNGYMPPGFDREKFDWFEAEMDGISDIQFQLTGVDYDLARAYMEKAWELMNRDDYLFERLAILDTAPWAIVGTTRHFYFKRMLKKLSRRTWNNCAGYINIDEGIGFQLDDPEITIQRCASEALPQLAWAATHAFLGADYNAFEKTLSLYLGRVIPLLSVSSFTRSHSTEDIHVVKERLWPDETGTKGE